MKVRPYVDSDLIVKVKVKYAKETAMLDSGATIEWALTKLLKEK